MKWFHHDTDARDDDRIFELGDRFGMQGYGFFWIVLEECYAADEDGFQIEVTETWCKKICKYFRVTDTRVIDRLLDGLADLALIDKQMWQDRIIVVPDIQQRADGYMKKRQDAAERKRRQRTRERSQGKVSENVTRDSSVTPCEIANVTPAEIRSQKEDLDLNKNNKISRDHELPKVEPEKGDLASPRVRKKNKTEKAAPKSYPDNFSLWWKSYYDFCQQISTDDRLVSPGSKKQALTSWSRIFPDDQPPADFFEGDEFYRRAKVAEFQKKGEATGVSHGCRYLGTGEDDPKWKQALDFHRRKTAQPGDTPAMSPVLAQKWEEFLSIAKQYGHQVETMPATKGKFLLNRKVERLEVGALDEIIELWRCEYSTN